METKLTLKLDKNTINRAKLFAKKRNISLSKMVEKYFKSLADENEIENKTKLVNELTGIINLDQSIDYRNEYTDYLIEKYK